MLENLISITGSCSSVNELELSLQTCLKSSLLSGSQIVNPTRTTVSCNNLNQTGQTVLKERCLQNRSIQASKVQCGKIVPFNARTEERSWQLCFIGWMPGLIRVWRSVKTQVCFKTRQLMLDNLISITGSCSSVNELELSLQNCIKSSLFCASQILNHTSTTVSCNNSNQAEQPVLKEWCLQNPLIQVNRVQREKIVPLNARTEERSW